MDNTPKCILQIKQLYPSLRGKYKAIADYFLANPEAMVACRGKEIAKACKCDDSQIIRFCQKLGYKGLAGMRSSIAAEFMPVDINPGAPEPNSQDPFDKTKREFAENYTRTVNDTVGLINEADVKKAVNSLSKAKRIQLLGTGMSGLAAMDLHTKLQRLRYNALYNVDPSLNQMLCGLLSKGDVVIALSFSGQTKEICELAATCKEKGATLISITNSTKSKLGELSDVVFLTASDEGIFRLGAMTSRVAQNLVVDFLTVNLALKDMDRAEKSILQTHQMIEKSR